VQGRFHREITLEALGDRFSPAALREVIQANLRLDGLFGQIGHDEYHFDQNAFSQSREFVERNRARVGPALEAGDAHTARRCLGRLTHTVQDFYAHSNYVSLWLRQFEGHELPGPEAIDALDATLLDSPELRSGRLYLPLEVLSFIPGIRNWVLPHLPPDSHAWMNLDGPEREPLFSYARTAAKQRTRFEFDHTIQDLPAELVTRVCT